MAILADLVRRFGTGPENVATETLNLILNSSSGTRKAFIRFCAQSGVAFPDNLTFRTQVRSDEHGQADLVGRCEKGNILVVEAKFDAGFTENQPVAYFEHFAVPGLLVFVVPEYRQQAVWLQLFQRCRDKGLSVQAVASTPWNTLVQVGLHHLGLVTWRSVLRFLQEAAHAVGDEEARNDLSQLSALCERMDEDAFRPFRAEELNDVGIARRIGQLMSLPAKVVLAAAGQGICEPSTSVAADSYAGRYIRIGRYTLYVGFFVNLWKRHPVSPIWLQTGADWSQNADLSASDKDQLRSSFFPFSTDPSRFAIEDAGDLYLPLLLMAGADQGQVVDYVVRQISDFRTRLLNEGPHA